MPKEDALFSLARYPLIDALVSRRSRRFGLGMKMETGPLAYRSERKPVPLTEQEDALLAFAACGVTGPALADLVFAPGEGGTIMAGLLGRTVGSGDAIQTVSVFVINDEGTYLLKRSRDFAPSEIGDLTALVGKRDFLELYRRSRVRIGDGRTAPPLEPMYNLGVNRWSLYDGASTYLLPVNELTLLYINGMLEILDEPTGAFVVDERASFQPAGLGRFAKSRGGHLHDDPKDERVLTIQALEGLVTEFVTIEQGMVMQNVQLMAQAIGLGGFPHWAAHPFGWLRALGFRMREMPASRYLGMGSLLGTLARLMGKDAPFPFALGLEKDGVPLLTPYCPPWYGSMEAAVKAIVDHKFGPKGVFREGTRLGAWREPEKIAGSAKPPSQRAIDATIAYCEYVHRRYGRFPAYAPPFRTVLGFQATHVDPDFYDRFYRPEALGESQRNHLERWHEAG
jgi:hypothetical protein